VAHCRNVSGAFRPQGCGISLPSPALFHLVCRDRVPWVARRRAKSESGDSSTLTFAWIGLRETRVIHAIVSWQAERMV